MMASSTVDSFIESQSRDRDNAYSTRLTFLTLPPPLNVPEPSTPNFFITFLNLHKPLVKQAVLDRIQSGSGVLSGFILDMFCVHMNDIAADFEVPWYVYFTSGANLLNLMFHIQSLVDDEGVDIVTELSNPDAEFDVPGFVNRVSRKVLPEVLLDKESGTSMMLNLARAMRKSKGILVNTYVELETIGTQSLFELVAKNRVPTIYPVGPILELNIRSDSGSQGDDCVSIIKWLDSQPSSSVVFLCFGSRGSFDEDQVKEMANGVEKSGYRFLWSLRKPPPEGKIGMPSENETFVEALPEGFLDRTTERGKIVGWAPQISILAHPSIGGFVSHCGWNSTLESLWFGVPMATWPLYAEQQLNAFELIKELGLAVEVRMDYRRDWKTRKANIQVSAEEIENGVKNLMSMDDEAKNRVREIRDKGRKTLEDGGSSHKWLGQFIEDVFSNIS